MHPKVKYELQELEMLLSSDHQQLGNDTLLKQSVKFETDRVMQALALEAFTFQNEDQLGRYIQYHQYAIIRLIDKVDGILSTNSSLDSVHKIFYQVYYSCLEELLLFVEQNFSKYFDHDAKPPEGYIAIAKQEAGNSFKKFRTALTSKNADARLIDLLLLVLRKIDDKNPERKITYRKVMYAREVQKELSHLLGCSAETLDFDEKLRQILYYLNYNSFKVLTYHAHYITALLDSAETRSEKIERLSFTLKKINQVQVKPGLQYQLRGLSLKEQLNSYIIEEIEYQEKLQQVIRSPEHTQELIPHGFKLKFTASVAQTAYLLRILVETKVILNSNLSQVLHFLVRYVITKRSEAISHNSFRSKYYAVESGTKESVRNMLVSLIRYIDKN